MKNSGNNRETNIISQMWDSLVVFPIKNALNYNFTKPEPDVEEDRTWEIIHKAFYSLPEGADVTDDAVVKDAIYETVQGQEFLDRETPDPEHIVQIALSMSHTQRKQKHQDAQNDKKMGDDLLERDNIGQPDQF